MTLSFNKLGRMLSKKGMIIKKIFAVNGLCVYIEVLCICNADSFLLYIPSKYEIQTREDMENVYSLSYIEVGEDGNIASDYGGEPDNFDLEKGYDEIDVNLGTGGDKEDLVGHLEENYNHPVSLKNITKDDFSDIRNVFRQLRRLKFCVQSIKYKLAIIYKNYICCIRRDDTFDGFIIKNFPRVDSRKLIVTMDLETLYDKIESIDVDIITVKEGVYKVLNKNQRKHTRNLQTMLQSKNDILEQSEVIYNRKLKYTKYLKGLQTLLTELGTSERKIIEKLMVIEDKYNDPGIKGLHNDIEKSHATSKLEEDLDRINKVKQDIISNIIEIKGKLENISLVTDKIFFDVSIMLDSIFKNFSKLTEIS
jgi:hypothetical protein